MVRTSLLGLEELEGDAESAVLDVPPSYSSCTDDDDDAEDPGRDGGSDVNFLMNEKKSFLSYLNTISKYMSYYSSMNLLIRIIVNLQLFRWGGP